jgi:hypothetical protein
MTKISTAKQKTYSNSNKFEKHSQLRLFPSSTSPQSLQPKETRPTNPPRSKPQPKPKPKLAIAPILDSEFDGNRFYLQYGDWKLALQLREVEANRLLERLLNLDWILDHQGIPTDLERIYAIAEKELKDLWNTLRLINKEGGA